MRTGRLYATALAGITVTAAGLAFGYPTPFVLVIAILGFGMALRQIADPAFDDAHYRLAFAGLGLGDIWIAFLWVVAGGRGLLLAYVTVVLAGFLLQRRLRHAEDAEENWPVVGPDTPRATPGSEHEDDDVRRLGQSSALDIAGIALTTSLLIHGLAVSHLRTLCFVSACIVLGLMVIGSELLRNRESQRRRWLAPRELVRASRRYASQGRGRRLHVSAWVLFFVFACLRFVVLLGQRDWARAAAELPLMIFWAAIAEHYCADIEPAPASATDDD